MTHVLEHMMLPLLVATDVSSPPGIRIVLRLVPALMATQVEQTMPHTKSTFAKALSKRSTTINLGMEDADPTEPAGSWTGRACALTTVALLWDVCKR